MSATTNAIVQGSMVKIKSGAKTYTGGSVAGFVYSGTYRVDELKGDRAVLDYNGIRTPFNVKDLTLSPVVSTPVARIAVGSLVIIKENAKTYTGGSVPASVYKGSYRVDELISGRAVLDKNGINLAFNIKDLILTASVPAASIAVGSMVRVKLGAKSYTGSKIAAFVYRGTYRVDELKGDRAVVDYNGIHTAFNVKDLLLVTLYTPPAKVAVGSMVKVNTGAKSYSGESIASFVYSGTYRVDELKTDRAVLDYNGIRTAFNVKDLTFVK